MSEFFVLFVSENPRSSASFYQVKIAVRVNLHLFKNHAYIS